MIDQAYVDGILEDVRGIGWPHGTRSRTMRPMFEPDRVFLVFEVPDMGVFNVALSGGRPS